jgi:hypothetical protein
VQWTGASHRTIPERDGLPWVLWCSPSRR